MCFDTSTGLTYCHRAVQTVNKLWPRTVRRRRVPNLCRSGRTFFTLFGRNTRPSNTLFATRQISNTLLWFVAVSRESVLVVLFSLLGLYWNPGLLLHICSNCGAEYRHGILPGNRNRFCLANVSFFLPAPLASRKDWLIRVLLTIYFTDQMFCFVDQNTFSSARDCFICGLLIVTLNMRPCASKRGQSLSEQSRLIRTSG